LLDGGLVDALASSQRLGMIGKRPIDEVIEHATAFVAALVNVSGTVIDLGAGGGVPGLVIATARPDLHLILIDRRATRTDHLRRLVRSLEVGARVDVVTADATTLGGWEADAAVARGFGPPATTLRAASDAVRAGGMIVVSEPPTREPRRWPVELLRRCGVAAVPSPDARVATFRRRVPRET